MTKHNPNKIAKELLKGKGYFVLENLFSKNDVSKAKKKLIELAKIKAPKISKKDGLAAVTQNIPRDRPHSALRNIASAHHACTHRPADKSAHSPDFAGDAEDPPASLLALAPPPSALAPA